MLASCHLFLDLDLQLLQLYVFMDLEYPSSFDQNQSLDSDYV
jgi:hypothetical protein